MKGRIKKMDALEFLKGYDRICESSNSCKDCCLRRRNNGTRRACSVYIKKCTEKAIQKIKIWLESHQNPTRQSEFLKLFPEARLVDGVLDIHPCKVDKTYGKEFCETSHSCNECRRNYWLREIKNN